ncbi:MAG: hypothetical protein P8I55_06040 [Crocinitomix sp.]|nr:hypothetical protein [Crocinitomix sp.]
MKKLFQKGLLYGGIAMLLSSCGGDDPVDEVILPLEEQPVYTFVAAGHAYGHPDTYTSSVYPPLLVKLDSLIAVRPLDQLVLMGDVVAHPTEENWETVRHELDSLDIGEWNIAPGNHDISPYMDEHIQSVKYMALDRSNSLFLLLNTTRAGWTVDSVQAQFIDTTLANAEDFDQIFVFTHQLWWEKNPPAHFDLDSLRPNSFALFDGENDFWQDGFPYFEDLEQEVYFFAGDMGCYFGLPGYYEDRYENYHFFGSGMGGAVEDNLIYGQIFQDGSVKIERVDF